MSTGPHLRFAPSRVEGLPDVTEVAVFPDRIELLSGGRWVVFRFWDIARWPRPAWLWRLLARAGWRRHWPMVGDRDWFHRPPDRFFGFFTTPKVVVYMPDERGVGYGQTCFHRLQEVVMAGGYATFDLG